MNGSGGPNRSPRPLILHVEDDANDLFLVKHAFGKAAPQAFIVPVTDGREAQAYLAGEGPYADRARHPLPDFVLLDLKLPRMGGLEVLEWMKSVPALAGLPAFILSSSSEKSDVDHARALGASGYHTKQGSVRAMVETLREIVTSLPPPPPPTAGDV
jgi:CheY-like chemotaxis protein